MFKKQAILSSILFSIMLVFLISSCQDENINPSILVSPESAIPKYDLSGDLEVRVWSKESSGLEHNPSVTVDVDPEFVLIGGGAWVENDNVGAYITESSPSTNYRTWTARSKDHLSSDPHSVVAYAVGLRIKGMTRSQLLNHVSISGPNKSLNGFESSPSWSAGVPSGYHLIGGGVKVHWSGSGNMVTESYPSKYTNRWYVKSKDHIKSSPAKISAWAIGIKKSIPGFGNILVDTPAPSSSYVGTGLDTEKSYVKYGYVTTCAGAKVSYNGSGRLLSGFRPDDPHADYTESRSKDHKSASSGNLYNYVIGIKKQ